MSSRCLLFFQKTNENNLTWGTIVVRSNFFVRFLEEFKITKRHFEINWIGKISKGYFFVFTFMKKSVFDTKGKFMKSWSFIIVLIHPSICVHNCSHRNMYLFLFPIWVWKLIFFLLLCFQLVTDHPCDHCQCRNGKISCYWQVCDGSPDFNCVPLFVPGTCCPGNKGCRVFKRGTQN